MHNEKYKVIFVVGAPGAGKNTQCDMLVAKYKFIHFSAGDLLRAEALKDSEEGRMVKSILAEGKIVPVKVTCGLIKQAMDVHGKSNIFLIDGYPRNKDNVDGWYEVFGDNFQVIASIYLTCNEETCVSRILERGKSSGRSDDKAEVIKKRFNTFFSESLPIIDILSKMGPLIEQPSIKSPEEVFEELCSKLDQYL